MREGYYTIPHSETKRECLDLMWYLWCGENSPLFGKDAMTTFERYFIEDKATHVENERAPVMKEEMRKAYAEAITRKLWS